jgi:hypothetical protein
VEYTSSSIWSLYGTTGKNTPQRIEHSNYWKTHMTKLRENTWQRLIHGKFLRHVAVLGALDTTTGP